ncbi:hypothetical protein [Shewanella algae]|uniref:hypothetical protein n=1 Tax=Shewanella algae TaxID=38313 RepID=UPI001AAF7E1B|nr:hypothetical protein [Shewanella algae]
MMKKVALIAAMALAGCGDGKPAEPTESMAYIQCKKAVSHVLKAPSTAEFGSYSDSIVTPIKTVTDSYGSISKTFLVVGYVDSQNGFGAMIRSKYTCQITGEPGNLWSTDSIDIM